MIFGPSVSLIIQNGPLLDGKSMWHPNVLTETLFMLTWHVTSSEVMTCHMPRQPWMTHHHFADVDMTRHHFADVDMPRQHE